MRTTAATACLALVLSTVVATASPVATAADPADRPARIGNLLLGDASGFDLSKGGWRGPKETTLGTTMAPSHSGTGALVVTNVSDRKGAAAWSGGDRTAVVPATPGFRYAARAYVRAQSTSRPVHPFIQFLDSSGKLVERVPGQPVKDSTSGWTALVDVSAMAPARTAAVAFGVAVETAARGESHYVDSASLTEARGGAASVTGPLRTVGNKILDVNGRQVVLRGVNRSGLENYNNKLMNQEEIERAKAWGANVVRIPLSDHLWLSTSCSYDPNYAANVDDAVRIVTGLGMVALVNLHWSSTTRCGKPGLVPGAAAAGASTFWKQVASRYKDNPLVAFDLYNEPHHLTDEIWRNGGRVTWEGVTYEVAGMQQMYDAVRSTGASNLVMISGNSWGNLWPKTVPPVTGSNIVYAIHLYTCPEVAPPHCTNPAPYDPVPMLSKWIVPGATYPLMVTEFGWPDPADGVYIRNLIAYAESNGWGWSAYTWSNESWSRWAIVANAGPGSSYQPRPVGMPVLAAFPGSAPS